MYIAAIPSASEINTKSRHIHPSQPNLKRAVLCDLSTSINSERAVKRSKPGELIDKEKPLKNATITAKNAIKEREKLAKNLKARNAKHSSRIAANQLETNNMCTRYSLGSSILNVSSSAVMSVGTRNKYAHVKSKVSSYAETKTVEPRRDSHHSEYAKIASARYEMMEIDSGPKENISHYLSRTSAVKVVPTNTKQKTIQSTKVLESKKSIQLQQKCVAVKPVLKRVGPSSLIVAKPKVVRQRDPNVLMVKEYELEIFQYLRKYQVFPTANYLV